VGVVFFFLGGVLFGLAGLWFVFFWFFGVCFFFGFGPAGTDTVSVSLFSSTWLCDLDTSGRCRLRPLFPETVLLSFPWFFVCLPTATFNNVYSNTPFPPTTLFLNFVS